MKLGGKTLTFYFPTQQTPRKVKTQGNSAVVGNQRVTLKDNHLALTVTGK